MFANFVSWVGGLVRGARTRLGLFAAFVSVGLGCMLSGTAFGQNAPIPIPMEAPNIDWMSLPATLIGVLTTPVVVGIGVALSIWVILRAMAFFRRAA